MMLGIAVFVLHALPEVVSAPNLQFPCINHFRQAFQSDNMQVSGWTCDELRTNLVMMMWILLGEIKMRANFEDDIFTSGKGYKYTLYPRSCATISGIFV